MDSYIAKYGPEWRRLERAVARGATGLARLPGNEIREVIRLYLRASSHLAEVQTRYGDARLLAYLNSVVGRAHAAIYSASPRSGRDAARLFGARYREAVHRTAPFVYAAAVVFVVFTAVTALWVWGSPDGRAATPPQIQEAARRASGERAGLGIDPAGISAFVLLNNVHVAFLAFALGIAMGVGTLWVLIQNAVLIGQYAGAFAFAGKASTFWAVVLPHGLLELTAIFIAAGAGLRMGWSIVAPGDRPRGRALAEEARDAVLVVLGVIPAFALAALIEGFVSGSALPDALELGLGVVAAGGYIVFLFGRDRTNAPSAGRSWIERHRRPKALIRRY